MAGSHDWEDFELKVRRRKNVVGLFCSLYPIDIHIHDRAKDLIKNGFSVIVLEGQFWDNLANRNLSLSDVLDYMFFWGNIKFIATPPPLNMIESWRFNKTQIIKKVSDICLKFSSTMLRRYKSNNHDKIYVAREIERQIGSYIKGLRPNILAKEKEYPKQICVLRDFSGSGKTTMSIQLLLKNDVYWGAGITANEMSIDQKCSSLFEALGEDWGIRELKEINRPIVLVIDSLDEASAISGKRNEILAILKYLDELNKKAAEFGLLAYPVLFIFTVREDYWRTWESVFEGRQRYDINRRFSNFTEDEFEKALSNYMNCYGYTVTNELSNETIEVLSKPINLLIFSETNKYTGQIEVHDIWECSVIYNYFVRKLDDIYKRQIIGYDTDIFMNLLSDIAYSIICSKITSINETKIKEIMDRKYSIFSSYCNIIIKVFISEYILVKDIDNMSRIRFRHSRFLEFLMAYYCIITIKENENMDLLDNLTNISFNSGLVLMFRIHNDMLYICDVKYPELKEKLNSYYSNSNQFMSRKISNIRYELANNLKSLNKNDIALILKNVNNREPQLIIEAFFVIVSKACKQSNIDIINIFVAAFKTKYNIPEQYKMILKLTMNNLLISEKVIECILQSNYPRNWETYLGGIIDTQKGNYDDFIELWNQVSGTKKIERLKKRNTQEWQQVEKLLNIILSNKKYIAGEFNL